MNSRARYSLSLLLACTLLASPFTSRAEDTGDDGTTFTLGEIVVSGKKPEAEAVGTVHEVTAADIQASGARDLNEAISLLPGVNIRVGAEGVPRIDIRGFRTRHVVLLLDGVPFSSAFDQQFDPTLIPVENIARIKVTAGPNSVLYGPGGLGGVINIITKKGSKEFKGMVGTETGDHEPYRTKGSVGGSVGNFDFFLSGSAADVDGFPLSGDYKPTTLQGKGYRNNSDSQRNNLFASFGFSPTRDISLGLTVSYLNGDYGKPASIIADPYDPFASTPKYDRVNNFNGYAVQLAADYQVTSQFSLRSWLYFNRLDQKESQYDNALLNSYNLVAGSFLSNNQSDVIGISLQPKYDFGKGGIVTLGLFTEKDSWKNNGFTTTAPNSYTLDNESRNYTLYSASAQYEVSLLPSLGLVLGYGQHWQERGERSDNGWSLMAGVHYDILKDTRLKASFQRNIRFPSIRQLYEKPSDNPLLQPEVAYLYEIGVEQKLPGKSLVSLTGFNTTANNFIQKDEATNKNLNYAECRFQGIELAGQTKIFPRLLLRGSYTYLDSKDKSTPGHDEYQYSPKHRVTLEGKYDFDFGLTPYVSFLYAGDQYTYTKSSYTPVLKAQMSNYTVVNMKLNQKILKDKMNFYIGLDNLFDANYETSYGFPQAGRFIYGGIEFRI
ncbi:MAG: TonB-dependent receptor [Deltaproteobacteria bacterium]